MDNFYIILHFVLIFMLLHSFQYPQSNKHSNIWDFKAPM